MTYCACARSFMNIINHVVRMEEDLSITVHTRSLHCELGIISRADGSAVAKHGNTTVTCGVYGPVEVRTAKEREDRSVVEVVIRKEYGLPGAYERQLELLISSCCESMILTHLHPHTAISISLLIQNDDGSVISVLTHALCLALLDSSLPLKSTFSSLTCSFTEEGNMLTDPTLDQQSSLPTLTYIVDRKSGLVCSHTNGDTFTTEQFFQGLEAAGSTVTQMTDFYRTSVSRKMSRVEMLHPNERND